jgi:hypothetical protein
MDAPVTGAATVNAVGIVHAGECINWQLLEESCEVVTDQRLDATELKCTRGIKNHGAKQGQK